MPIVACARLGPEEGPQVELPAAGAARQLEDEPGRCPGLTPGACLGQQTHLLSPEQVRAVALELARRRGLGG